MSKYTVFKGNLGAWAVKSPEGNVIDVFGNEQDAQERADKLNAESVLSQLRVLRDSLQAQNAILVNTSDSLEWRVASDTAHGIECQIIKLVLEME